MKLRDYQENAVEATFKEWEESRSTLVVAATGTGKTQIFCEIIRRMAPKRAMILCHRNELILQAVKRLKSFGIEASIEMAGYMADNGVWRSQVVVSTIQTQISGKDGEGRMLKFKPSDFDYLIIDEAHHATSASWVKCINYYKLNEHLKVLGVTATPDRADEAALGQVFETVAFEYEIIDAIREGWLCPVQQQLVHVTGLDFSAIRTTAGDLNGADLAEVMEAEENLQGIASATLDIIGKRRAIVFTVSVKQAEMLSSIFNRHRQGMSGWICGKTPREQRDSTLSEFDAGITQIMVNVGVLTEGYDSPGVEVIVMARPTKSRSLYSQMIGRATRPLPGTVDGLVDAQERKDAIEWSGKDHCLVVDFVGNSGRHRLMTTADVLGGKASEEAIASAKKKAEDGEPVNMMELIAEEEERLRLEAEERKRQDAARKAKLIAKAKFSVRTINPFELLDIEPHQARGWDHGRSLTEKQRALLLKSGVDITGIPYSQQKQLLNTLFSRWNSKLATFKQVSLLKKHGVNAQQMTMKDATAMIDILAKNNWKFPVAQQ